MEEKLVNCSMSMCSLLKRKVSVSWVELSWVELNICNYFARAQRIDFVINLKQYIRLC
jgi:hypothetical protein